MNVESSNLFARFVVGKSGVSGQGSGVTVQQATATFNVERSTFTYQRTTINARKHQASGIDPPPTTPPVN
ncbi:MAG: hypothetical protein SGI86_23200 [Deltaproteobacteria bacterium]|nr:hypothetical protein [Deltaproteobacteria bacterium]